MVWSPTYQERIFTCVKFDYEHINHNLRSKTNPKKTWTADLNPHKKTELTTNDFQIKRMPKSESLTDRSAMKQ